MWKFSSQKKKNKSLPMHPNNILIISSSARELDIIINLITKKGNYHTNSDMIRLDNGDFAQVVEQE